MPVSSALPGPVAFHRFETLADASEALAQAIAIRLKALLERQASALLAVPGGTTPGRLLASLGALDLDWDKVTLLPTDERLVPADDPASNEAMIRAAFLPLRAGKARFVSFHQGGQDADEAARIVDAMVAALPPIDLLVSGMGADGHIASLFPGQPASVDDRAGVHVLPARPPGLPERISLSPARLSGAGWAALLISGAEKAETLASAQALSAAFPVGLLLGRRQGLDVYWAKA